MANIKPSQFLGVKAKIDPREYFKRPARQQITGDAQRTEILNDGSVYNIYYGRFQGGDRQRFNQVDRATTRLVVSRDAGRTKSRPKGYYCIHFARGCCNRGANCQFIHNVPLADFTEKAYDCFGRERFKDERDDMGGVGSFERENKTLYVGNIALSGNMEEIVARHFSEWGDLENVRVIHAKGVAFVRYKYRAQAEFAKVAMHGQSLDDNEILNVRWAADDPSSTFRQEIQRQDTEKVFEAIGKQLPQVGDMGNVLDYQGYYDNEQDNEEQKKKKQRLEEDKEQIAVDVAPTQVPAINNPEALALGQFDYAEYYAKYAEYAKYYGQENHYTVAENPATAGEDHAEEYYDNSAYAILPDASSTMATAGSETTSHQSREPPSGLGALAAYGSDSDDD